MSLTLTERTSIMIDMGSFTVGVVVALAVAWVLFKLKYAALVRKARRVMLRGKVELSSEIIPVKDGFWKTWMANR